MAFASPPATAGAAALVPIEQTLELAIDPERAAWHGTFGATLAVRRGTRDVVLRFAGPTVSRVEMSDAAGRVDLVWGLRGADSMRIETRRPLRPGRAELAVSFESDGSGSPPTFARAAARSVALARGEGRVFPAWPDPQPATRWTLIVHVPRGFVARSNLARRSVVPMQGWITFTDRSRSALRADGLRIRVEPARVARAH